MDAVYVVFYIIFIIVIIWLIFWVVVSPNIYILTLVRVLLVLWLISLLFLPWWDTNDRCKKECSKEYKPKFHWISAVNATSECPESIQVCVDKMDSCKDGILNISLEANEIDQCWETPVVKPMPGGYSESWNIVIPHLTNAAQKNPDVKVLLEWTSPNNTNITVKYVGSFENIVVDIIPAAGVNFVGNMDFSVINNGLITKLKSTSGLPQW
jgi:hypothetical protein